MTDKKYYNTAIKTIITMAIIFFILISVKDVNNFNNHQEFFKTHIDTRVK